MNMLEMLLHSCGIDAKMLAETQQVFVQMGDFLNIVRAQLDRIEMNTLQILEATGDTAPAGATRYDLMSALPRLPPMIFEERDAA